MRTLPEHLRLVHENANKKEQGAECLQHFDPSNRNQHNGGASMADDGQYTDSASVDNPAQKETWQSISELAARLVRK